MVFHINLHKPHHRATAFRPIIVKRGDLDLCFNRSRHGAAAFPPPPARPPLPARPLPRASSRAPRPTCGGRSGAVRGPCGGRAGAKPAGNAPPAASRPVGPGAIADPRGPARHGRIAPRGRSGPPGFKHAAPGAATLRVRLRGRSTGKDRGRGQRRGAEAGRRAPLRPAEGPEARQTAPNRRTTPPVGGPPSAEVGAPPGVCPARWGAGSGAGPCLPCAPGQERVAQRVSTIRPLPKLTSEKRLR